MEHESPRKKRKIGLTGVKTYFKTPYFQNSNEIYECKECGKHINGNKGSNLAAHLQRHEQLYSQICDNGLIERNRLELLLNCVEFVAVDGNPFSSLNKTGLQSMIKKQLNELNQAGRSVNLKDPHLYEVKEMLQKTAQNVRQIIREELKNRLFSLKVDITTKRRRSIFGVSAQFIVDGKHIIRSIGMLQLDESHTGEYLAKMIWELLSTYGVMPQQILAITTDNGANVVKMVRDVSTQMISIEKNHQAQSRRIINENIDIDASDAEIEEYLLNVPECTDEQALDILFDEIDSDDEIEEDIAVQYDELLNEMVSNLQNVNDQKIRGTSKINSMCCTYSAIGYSRCDIEYIECEQKLNFYLSPDCENITSQINGART